MKQNINALMLTCYIMVVNLAYLFVNVTTEKDKVVPFLFLLGIGSYLLISWVMKKTSVLSISEKQKVTKKRYIFFGIFSVVSFLILLMWYIAYYPGSYSTDSIAQVSQVVHGAYTDWHPVLHTLLVFKIPLVLTGKVSSIVLFQIIVFSLFIGVFCTMLLEIAGWKGAVISFLYIMLNPYTGGILMYPWKDVAFSIGAALATALAIKLCYSVGEIKSGWKKVILPVIGILLALTTIFRHNAILYTAPLMVAIMFCLGFKKSIPIAAFFLLALFFIKVPLYHSLGVPGNESRVIECTGMPLTVIANVAKETPDRMDAQLQDFVYSIGTQEQWNEYECGNFNSIKWSGIDCEPIEAQGTGGMLLLMFKCFRLSPIESFRAFFALTDIVYGIETGLEGDIIQNIANNEFGIVPSWNPDMVEFLGSYCEYVNHSALRYFRTYGVALIIMLFAILSKMEWNSKKLWKKLLFCLPVFSYDFGTMLLLTGPDSRFFYVTFLVCPLVIVFMFAKDICGRVE